MQFLDVVLPVVYHGTNLLEAGGATAPREVGCVCGTPRKTAVVTHSYWPVLG